MYPQLLLARLLFSLGGCATATMVTATLPAMTAPPFKHHKPGANTVVEYTTRSNNLPSPSSELTITPGRITTPSSSSEVRQNSTKSSPTTIAGFVGLFTGLGALVALGLFLPLLAQLQKSDAKPGTSIVYTYYIVGTVAILVAVVCSLGLRDLNGEEHKGWDHLRNTHTPNNQSTEFDNHQSSWTSFLESIRLGVVNSLIGLGYLGGFVARASSVGISLFVPLYVNAYFISTGRCKDPVSDPSEIQNVCKEAYILAAKLTGTSQLVALIMAPVFGFFADRYQQSHVAVLLAAFAGILGYGGLANLTSPMSSGDDGNPIVFLFMSLIGVSQIGCIVCSLGLLGRGISGLENPGLRQAEGSAGEPNSETSVNRGYSSGHPGHFSGDDIMEPSLQDATQQTNNLTDSEETTSLLHYSSKNPQSLNHLKGSIAGIYSFGGGAGILLLTKLGGYLFDAKSNGAPFYMLAIFNTLLLVATGVIATFKARPTFGERTRKPL